MTTLEPGRELDALVASKVMGHAPTWWSLHPAPDSWDDLPASEEGKSWGMTISLTLAISQKADSPDGCEVLRPNEDGDMAYMTSGSPIAGPCPAYSTDISAAWAVVERMVREDVGWDGPIFKPTSRYLTNEGYPLGTECWFVRLNLNGYLPIIAADTAPHAICLAALKALETADAHRIRVALEEEGI